MTVRGPVAAGQMGITLAHEHLYADLRPYSEQTSKPVATNLGAVAGVILPRLKKIRALGCRTLIDCTGTTLGRNPLLLKRISTQSGLNIVIATGAYLAAAGRFTPPYVLSETSDELAARWIAEWQDGIGGSGVRPGLIKLGVEGSPLTAVERKVVEAGAKAHLRTGLAIGVHTGPWREADVGANGRAALEQLDVLEANGVPPSAWIWFHAQSEKDVEFHQRAAKRGGWLSFDGYRPNLTDQYVSILRRMRDSGLLRRTLISQDAGWYNAAEPGGGEFNSYDPLLATLVPALRANGFGPSDIRTLLVDNPANAFATGRRTREIPATG